MILKIEMMDRSNKYKLIDNIEEFDYEYISMKSYDKILNEVVAKTTENGHVLSFVDKKHNGNFVLLTIEKNNRQDQYILTNLSVYALNDRGDTIERIRY